MENCDHNLVGMDQFDSFYDPIFQEIDSQIENLKTQFSYIDKNLRQVQPVQTIVTTQEQEQFLNSVLQDYQQISKNSNQIHQTNFKVNEESFQQNQFDFQAPQQKINLPLIDTCIPKTTQAQENSPITEKNSPINIENIQQQLKSGDNNQLTTQCVKRKKRNYEDQLILVCKQLQLQNSQKLTQKQAREILPNSSEKIFNQIIKNIKECYQNKYNNKIFQETDDQQEIISKNIEKNRILYRLIKSEISTERQKELDSFERQYPDNYINYKHVDSVKKKDRKTRRTIKESLLIVTVARLVKQKVKSLNYDQIFEFFNEKQKYFSEFWPLVNLSMDLGYFSNPKVLNNQSADMRNYIRQIEVQKNVRYLRVKTKVERNSESIKIQYEKIDCPEYPTSQFINQIKELDSLLYDTIENTIRSIIIQLANK